MYSYAPFRRKTLMLEYVLKSTRGRGTKLSAVFAVAIAGVVSLSPASASVIGTTVNIDFSGTSTTFDLAPGAGYTLYGDNGDFFNPVDISTSGSALVNSLGLPFYNPPQPTSYFTDRGVVSFDASQQYSAFPVRTNIPYSLNDTFVGLSFSAPDGAHFGFLEFDGTKLISYAYESVAGATIVAGPIPAPEPTTLMLLGAGLGLLGVVRRKRH
jgi:PEP-CTERM motif